MEKKEEIRIPWGSGIVGYVAKSGETLNIPDAYQVGFHIISLLYPFFCSFFIRVLPSFPLILVWFSGWIRHSNCYLHPSICILFKF